jgi:hypothetical protein
MAVARQQAGRRLLTDFDEKITAILNRHPLPLSTPIYLYTVLEQRERGKHDRKPRGLTLS